MEHPVRYVMTLLWNTLQDIPYPYHGTPCGIDNNNTMEYPYYVCKDISGPILGGMITMEHPTGWASVCGSSIIMEHPVGFVLRHQWANVFSRIMTQH